ncbi:MAG: Rieske (2Fe-2S) protein [Nitrospiria bacterium]
MSFIKVLKTLDLRPDGKKIVEINGLEIALFNIQDQIYAISNICPHNGGSLGEGMLFGQTLLCPLHFWKFNIATGKSSNQPAYRVETYPVKLEKEWIYLDLPEEDPEE